MASTNYMKFDFSEAAPDLDPGISAGSHLIKDPHHNSHFPKTAFRVSHHNDDAFLSQYNTGFVPYICALWLVLIFGVEPSFADDVPLPLRDFLQRPEVLGYSQLGILVANFSITFFIECLVICGFLGWPEKAIVKVIFWVLIMNLMTNPLAQVGAIFFGRAMGSESLAWLMIGLVELAVIAAEFCLLRFIFRNMYNNAELGEPVTGKRLIVMVTAANAASFFFGFVVLILLLMAVGDPT